MKRIDWETAAAFGECFGALSTAQSGNFLDGGTLAAPKVSAPKLTAAQVAANTKALAVSAQARQRAAAATTASTNAAYLRHRKAEQKLSRDTHETLMRTSPAYAAREKAIRTAGTDVKQLLAGGAVIATGAAAIATGGALAGALAVPSAASALGAAAAADRLIATAEKAKLAPGGVSSAASKAKAVLDTTAALAAKGVPDAQAGLKVIATTAAQRVASGAIPGVPQALTANGAAALSGYAASAPPAVSAALASSAPVALVKPGKRPALVSNRAPLVATVDWFVSTAGKVTRGGVSIGKGWRVYSDGKVVKQ